MIANRRTARLLAFFALAAVIVPLLSSAAHAQTNVSLLYGWNGTIWKPLLTSSDGTLQTDLNITESVGIDPKANNTYGLGNTLKQWLNLFVTNVRSAGFLAFFTGGSERVRITDTGNVGINTTTPLQRFAVRGDVNFTAPTDSTTAFTVYNRTAGAVFDVDSTNNRVGIGTAAPNERLTVEGAISLDEISSISSTTGYGKLYVNISDGDLYFINGTGSITDLTLRGGEPAGTVIFYNGTSCPSGYSEVTGARGRVLVGLPSGGTLEGTVGTALSNLSTRTISSVAAHTHAVDPPSTASGAENASHTHTGPSHTHDVDPASVTSGGEAAHTHAVNPPATSTDSQGAHTHGITDPGHTHTIERSSDQAAGQRVARGPTAAPDQNTLSATTGITINSAGAHTHTIDIGAFTSGAGSSHTHSVDVGLTTSTASGTGATGTASATHAHTTDIGSFTSGSTGDASVDVTMPYIQYITCIKTVGAGTTGNGWEDSGTNVYLSNNSDRVGIGTTSPLQKLVVVGDANITGELNVSSLLVDGGSVLSSLTGANNIAVTGSGSSRTISLSGLTIPLSNISAYSISLPAANVTSGTFGSGDYTFPRNVTIGSNLTVNGSVLVVNGTSGNVGIGTTSPNFPLVVTKSTGVVDFELRGDPPELNLYDTAGTIDARRGRWTYDGGAVSWQFLNDADTALSGAGNALTILQSSGNVGIGTTTPGEKLTVSGNVSSTAFFYSSDASLKENVTGLDGLETVSKLRGVSFAWKDSGRKGVGLIAQDVEQVLPEVVTTDSYTGLKSLNYGALTAPLIEAVKELKAENDKLKKENAQLERAVLELQADISDIKKALDGME